ncbi:MAG: hypothetical protein COS76_01720 [Candidatus Portnoybacteria bacterium CG06_land_8_20_14_3_00_39_12]|uniref:CxxC-x17-CxxC domain-containing protein n=1 Tax=Candidatus Portnoybacteria bacterium CG06_land_8_20_14_3_00_39_12 TaxID=1974809 RepID=A0A2M7AXB0_9BACT|nr:MAG: hypothetical protein COS76_01720 [Candidatus Portnoybacteria bacterium CG06_land_8_20_14_3_00_39_12]
MAYTNQQDGYERKMYKGNWKCAKCGTTISELPFQPDPDKTDRLYCRDCHRQNRDDRPRRDNFGPRPMFQGDWQCSKCGTKINELPFEPHDDQLGTLLCRDCYRASRPAFGGGRGR